MFSIWHKPPSVVMLGPPGVGKTSLLHSLLEHPLDGSLPSAGVEPQTLKLGGHSVNVTDVSCCEWRPYVRDVAKAPPIGFIIVVAYGYHSNRVSEGILLDDLESRLELGRKVELELLERQLDACLASIDAKKSSRAVDWVLTIVNKADLWWDQKTKVERFYRNEFQRSLLGVLRRHSRAAKAMPITKYYSCRIQRFFGIANPSASFDDNDRWRLRDGLQSALAEALEHSMDKS